MILKLDMLLQHVMIVKIKKIEQNLHIGVAILEDIGNN
jgi:hypothetical protein